MAVASRAIALVHSPFTGPLCWRGMARLLESRGHNVVVPRLTSLFARNDVTHDTVARFVAREMDATAAHSAALVVHSGAGSLVPAVVALSSVPVRAVVYADAILPHPGASWLSTLPEPIRSRLLELSDNERLATWDRWLPPGAIEAMLPDHALREAFTSELPRVCLSYANAVVEPQSVHEPPPSGYVRLSATYEAEAKEAERLGWPVRRMALHHLACVTRPEAVAEAILDLIGTIDSP